MKKENSVSPKLSERSKKMKNKLKKEGYTSLFEYSPNDFLWVNLDEHKFFSYNTKKKTITTWKNQKELNNFIHKTFGWWADSDKIMYNRLMRVFTEMGLLRKVGVNKK